MDPDRELLRRLDPALHAFAAARTDLSPSALGAVRKSLDARRAEVVELLDSAGVDITDGTAAGGVKVRIYRGAPSPSPAVIYCHAGAFVLGNLDTDHRQCVELARRGSCTVISVDYRLAPEHPFPAALDDVAAVMQWAYTEADLGLDRDRLVLAGNSAGGALAAGLAQRAAAEEVPPVVGLLLHQPALDDRPTASKAEFVATPGFDGVAVELMWRHYLAGAAPSVASVPGRSHQLIGAADTFITCSELDPLRDEAADYAGELMRSGVRTDLHIFGGTCHGFDSLRPDWEVSQTLVAMQGDALRRFFGLP